MPTPRPQYGLLVVLLAGFGQARADELPLHTAHHWIVDAKGHRVKLAGVNWYGADNVEFSVGGLAYRPLSAIAHEVKVMGFNSVRIPWSNELVETNPVVPDYAVAANPALKGKRAGDSGFDRRCARPGRSVCDPGQSRQPRRLVLL
jgi:hypothetical protein